MEKFALPSTIVIDGDSYYSLIANHVNQNTIEYPYVPTVYDDRDRRSIFILQYLFRSSLVILDGDAGEGGRLLGQWSKLCADVAAHYVKPTAPFTGSHSGRSLPQPRWIWHIKQDIDYILASFTDEASSISVVPTLENRLHARSVPARGEIYISALTREHLKYLNLIFWNAALMAMERTPENVEPSELVPFEMVPFVNSEHGAKVVTSLLLAAYRDVNHLLLPIIRARNVQSLEMANRWTRIQLAFVLGHEYAHILLHKDKEAGAREIEDEADAFAYGLVSRLGYDAGEVWIVMRWYFKLLALQRALGLAINGYPVDWVQEHIQARSLNDRRHPNVTLEPEFKLFDALSTNLVMSIKIYWQGVPSGEFEKFVEDFSKLHKTFAYREPSNTEDRIDWGESISG